MIRLRSWLLVAQCLALVPPAAQAMTFSTEKVSDTAVMINMTGEVVLGDDRKLHEFVGSLPGNVQVVAVALHSGGGNLQEATLLAKTVRGSNVITGVRTRGMCASACFLIFSAGVERVAADSARIGVHSVSEVGGKETLMAQAFTTVFARSAVEYGVPPPIIGKLVTTPAASMTWLSHAELRSMSVRIIPETKPAATPTYVPGGPLMPGSAQATPMATAAQPAPPPPGPVTQATTTEPSPAYREGLRDRAAWEDWIGGLSQEERAGADWWASVRSHAARDRLTCSNQGFYSAAVVGCAMAVQKLTAADNRRKIDPDYRAGWNAY